MTRWVKQNSVFLKISQKYTNGNLTSRNYKSIIGVKWGIKRILEWWMKIWRRIKTNVDSWWLPDIGGNQEVTPCKEQGSRYPILPSPRISELLILIYSPLLLCVLIHGPRHIQLMYLRNLNTLVVIRLSFIVFYTIM